MIRGKKILGVDFGEKRIGLAISYSNLAEPLSIIEVSGPPSLKLQRAVSQIAKICEQEKIEEIVLGVPNGSKKVRSFGQKLSQKTGLKITFWDETLTSEEALAKIIQAGKGQKKRRRLDDISAAVILQEYLDSRFLK